MKPNQEEKTKILVVWQDYKSFNSERLGDISQNVNELKKVHQDSVHRDQFEIKDFISKGKEFTSLRSRLLEEHFDILHFSLHGNGKQIHFSNEDQAVPYDDLHSAIKSCNALRAVIFNVCQSADLAREVSSELNIATLGWENEPVVTQTNDVTRDFYIPLFAGKTVEEALAQVRVKEGHPVKFMPSMRTEEAQARDTVSNEGPFRSPEPHKGSGGAVEDAKPTGTTGTPIGLLQTGAVHPAERKRKLSWVLWLAGLTLLAVVVWIVVSMVSGEKKNGVEVKGMSIPTSPGEQQEECMVDILTPFGGERLDVSVEVVLEAVLPEGRRPWIYVAPPGSGQYYPQFGGYPDDVSGKWKFSIQLGEAGEENTSGEYTILALVVDSVVARHMEEWLFSQGSSERSQPLTALVLRGLDWCAADSVKVVRE